MTTGVVTVVSPKRSGDTLAAATLSTDTVLLVDDAGDFAEDFSVPRYLVIGDETTPRQYVAVENDEDAQQSVTLAAPVGSALEAGLPVTLWDDDAAATDKRAVEHRAWVQLDDAEEPIPATVPHDLIPLSGVFTLIGARVRVEETEPESRNWYVTEVLGREPLISVDEFSATKMSTQTFLADWSAEWIRISEATQLNGMPAIEFGAGQFLDNDREGYIAAGTRGSAGGQQPELRIRSASGYDTGDNANRASLVLVGRNENGNVGSTRAEVTAGTVQLSPLAGTGTATVQANADGELSRATSTRRVKARIGSLPSEVDALLNLEPREYALKAELDEERPHIYAGFIAEEAEALGLSHWVLHDETGQPRTFLYEQWTAALQKIVRHQRDQIEALTARVEALEGQSSSESA